MIGMKTFSFSGPQRRTALIEINQDFEHTDAAEEEANALLEKAESKLHAVEALVKLGWSSQMIQKKIRYSNGEEIATEHLNALLRHIGL